tara:strand:- start:5774 stop:6241 length:468 start_codon:yes stop_codon:yes gene_type:complete
VKKIDLSVTGIVRNSDKVVVRKFLNMKKSYKDISDFKKNPIIYKVHIIDFSVFEAGLTIIEPGTVNGEYYMTKGHRHIKSTKEIYFLLGGKGKLIIQGKKAKVFDLKKGQTYLLPKNAGHRLINTGSKKLEVLTIYSKNAGHDYNFKFTKRFFKK